MSNYNEEEILLKQYDSKLMKRLLAFAKPFKKYLSVVMLLMVISTIIGLVRPALIRNIIDDDLNGYRGNYIALTTPREGSVKIGELYLSPLNKNEENNLKQNIYSMIYLNKKAYLVQGNINHNKGYSLEREETFIQDGQSFPIYKTLSKDDIKALRKNDLNGLNKIVILILASYIIGFLVNYIQIYILQLTGQKIIFNIRQKLFRHIDSLSLTFFDNTPVGKLVTRITNDVQTLNEMYTGVLIYLIKDVFMIVGILVAMFLLNIKLTLISIITLPIIFITAILFKKYDRIAYRKVRERLSKINAFLSENISGMKVVQIYNKEEKKFKEFDKINSSYKEATLDQLTVFAVFRPTIELLSSLTMALLIWFGGIRVLNLELEFGVLFAFVNYITMFFQPIFDLTEKYDILQSAMASSERIFLLLDNDNIIKNSADAKSLDKLHGEIEFRNVWFAYKDEDWVLRDVSFKISKGEKIAFVGATGAGKTSIISLITRLYDIQKGEILIDGINIKSMKKEDLRRNIATVLQDVFLFAGDIKSNISLNKEDITEEAVIKACQYVNADKFIEKLPNKYDSPVNERGTTFSQGQRQLMAFARAIAFNPPILVLDEATSNIDTETEKLIQDALKKITEHRTTIIVAHRLSTIKNCDKIIVLHKGKIRELGTHEELVSAGGLYHNLYKLQYSE